MERYKSWVEYDTISDHSTFLLELVLNGTKVFYPLKFNHSWLKENEFKGMVRSEWSKLDTLSQGSIINILVQKLSILKKSVINCEKERKQCMQQDLLNYERELNTIYIFTRVAIFRQIFRVK